MASRQQILLLRNFAEDLQPSMKIYANLLEHSFQKTPNYQLHSFRVRPNFLDPLLTKNKWSKKLSRYLSRYISYPLALKNVKGDLFHIVDHGNASLIKRLAAEKTIITCHDLILLKMKQGFFPGHRPPLLAWKTFKKAISCLKDARLVIADSHSTADDLLQNQLVKKEKLEVVHLPVLPQFKPLAKELRQLERKKLNLAEHFVILSLGVNDFYKNIEGLLKTVALCQQQRPQLSLKILRLSTPLSAKQKTLAKNLALDSKIIELGKIESSEQLNLFYNISDLLLFPSLYEGYGWPVAEAQAAGLTAICSDRGSLQEVAADPLLCFPPDNQQQMAEKIIELAERPQLIAAHREKGLAKARQRGLDNFCQQMTSIYQSLDNHN